MITIICQYHNYDMTMKIIIMVYRSDHHHHAHCTAQPEVAEPKRVVDREQLDVRQDEPAGVVDHSGCV